MGSGSISGCCKKPPAVVAAVAVDRVQMKPKGTPNGFGRLFAGVRTSDNCYTSPVLTLHTWHKSVQLAKTHGGILSIANGQNSSWLGQQQSDTILQEARVKQEAKLGLGVNIQIIPIEDIISINVESEVKKAVEEEKTRRVKTPPPEDLSCGQKTKKCCVRNVCCWCCKEKKVAPEFVETAIQKQKAVRSILVTIRHVRYGNVDTPSNVRVLSAGKQAKFYEEQLEVDTIKFYYFHDETIDEHVYNNKLQESETLARLVIQLKGMSGHYPDTAQLEQIFKQQEIHPFGYEYNENLPTSTGSVQRTTNMLTTNSNS